VPVTSAAPPVGVSVASAAHRSQNTVAVPYAVFPAKEMFDSVYPYDGFGTITAAAHLVVDIAYVAVAVTVDARRLPPVLVVSTRTYEEPTDSRGADCDGDGVARGVPEMDGVPERVPEGVGEVDFVFEPDCVCVMLCEGVPLDDAPADDVPVCEGVWLGDGATTPATYSPAP
jgi:hypothetical protein